MMTSMTTMTSMHDDDEDETLGTMTGAGGCRESFEEILVVPCDGLSLEGSWSLFWSGEIPLCLYDPGSPL